VVEGQGDEDEDEGMDLAGHLLAESLRKEVRAEQVERLTAQVASVWAADPQMTELPRLLPHMVPVNRQQQQLAAGVWQRLQQQHQEPGPLPVEGECSMAGAPADVSSSAGDGLLLAAAQALSASDAGSPPALPEDQQVHSLTPSFTGALAVSPAAAAGGLTAGPSLLPMSPSSAHTGTAAGACGEGRSPRSAGRAPIMALQVGYSPLKRRQHSGSSASQDAGSPCASTASKRSKPDLASSPLQPQPQHQATTITAQPQVQNQRAMTSGPAAKKTFKLCRGSLTSASPMQPMQRPQHQGAVSLAPYNVSSGGPAGGAALHSLLQSHLLRFVPPNSMMAASGQALPPAEVVRECREVALAIAAGMASFDAASWARWLPGWVVGGPMPLTLVRRLWPIPRTLLQHIKPTQFYRAFPSTFILEGEGHTLALLLTPEARHRLVGLSAATVEGQAQAAPLSLSAPSWPGPHASFRHLGRIIVPHPEMPAEVLRAANAAAESLARSLARRPNFRSLLMYVERDLVRELPRRVREQQGFQVAAYVHCYPDMFVMSATGGAVELAPGAVERLARAHKAAAVDATGSQTGRSAPLFCK